MKSWDIFKPLARAWTISEIAIGTAGGIFLHDWVASKPNLGAMASNIVHTLGPVGFALVGTAIGTFAAAMTTAVLNRREARFHPELLKQMPEASGASASTAGSQVVLRPLDLDRARVLMELDKWFKQDAIRPIRPEELASRLGLDQTNQVLDNHLVPILQYLRSLGLVEMKWAMASSQITPEGVRFLEDPREYASGRISIPSRLVEATLSVQSHLDDTITQVISKPAYAATTPLTPSASRPIRCDIRDQASVLRGLIVQMGVPEMWLSQILQRGAGGFDGIPAGSGLVDYPTALKHLASERHVTILESTTRPYKDFYGEVFTEDIRFRINEPRHTANESTTSR